ncbi:MAG: serine/threonine-protein kinase [Acidobacteria bacterium]|nr:serine/threonine-protein kinase [Acidobacteriota bacterium]
MALAPGNHLGPYEVVAPIGAGGMGEVWRAKDTRLDRDVAVKVLPPGFASNPQLKARFEREARTISSLNHPNICTLFDVGHHEETHFLVMELLDGESLADRLQKGPLAPDQLLRVGSQLADALDRAHKQGIIHRDLKPGNVMLTKTGAKLLDFGLARSGVDSNPLGGFTEAATQARPLTQEGTILGTFQYMAPEQLEGREADARTDIFALGALLYEMATAKRAFEGSTKTSLIAAIVSSHPAPISSVTPMTPPALDHIVRKCLEKDPDDRWQSAHDVASELRWLSEAGSQAGVATSVTLRRKTREKLAWGLAALFALSAIVATAAWMRRAPKPAEPFRATIEPPAEAALIPFDLLGLSLSPDGRRLAFAANLTDGGRQLWIRDLDSMKATPVVGTTGASYPFWSPDGRHLGFFADGKLKKLDLRGGSPQVLADAPTGRGGTWGARDLILYAPNIRSPIKLIPAMGGKPKDATRFDETKEVTNRLPHFLPDGRHFVYISRRREASGEVGRLMLASLDSLDSTELIEGSTNAQYIEPGYLLFGRGNDLYAWRFDTRKLRLIGQPVPVQDEKISLWEPKNLLCFTASNTGQLVYLPEVARKSALRWVGRDGRPLGDLGTPAFNVTPRISPDGTKVAVAIAETTVNVNDMWILDLQYDRRFRITQKSGLFSSPMWSRDSKKLAFVCQPRAAADLCVKSLSSAGDVETLFQSPYWKATGSWTPDGSAIYISEQRPDTNEDVLLLGTTPNAKPSTILRTPFSETSVELSSDAKWLAYTSDESGRTEVYVRPASGSFEQWQISNGGGAQVRWTRGDKELLYVAPDGQVMSVAITATPVFRPGVPKALFALPEPPDRDTPIFEDVTADGERILLNVPTTARSSVAFHVILNWTSLLRED